MSNRCVIRRLKLATLASIATVILLVGNIGLGPTSASAGEPKFSAASKLDIVQSFKGGEDGLPKPFLTAYSFVIKGNFIYVGGNDISCFQRDPASGKLTFLGQVADVIGRVTDAFPAGRKWGKNQRNTCNIHLIGNRLYAIPQWGTAMAWYDIDDKSGKLTEKGMVECPPSAHAVVSPDQKDIYLLTNPYAKQSVKMALAWYHLEADGKPVKMGAVMGKGIGGTDQTPYGGLLHMSPDGKHIYAISGDDHALALIERKPGGEIAFGKTIDLEQTAVKPNKGKYPWAATLISPDGQWVYAHLWRYGKPAENFFGIYQRDPQSGELTFKATFSGDENVLANRRGWQNVHFFKDGTGYFGHYDLGLWTFNYDAKTGRLLNPTAVKESQRYKANLAIDQDNGLMYIGGVWIIEGGIIDGFRVLKMEAKK